MPNVRVKITIPNVGPVEGERIPITESTERWTDLKLEDGTVLRVKPAIISVIRVDNRYDQEGNPMYAIQGGQIMTIASVEDHLKRDAGKEKKVQ
ncbi:MAG: hypothetical protein P4N24_22485 [Acidobacteriota bacterium]|nr:hypothetical protein [Acidobacteriota bacterium]